MMDKSVFKMQNVIFSVVHLKYFVHTTFQEHKSSFRVTFWAMLVINVTSVQTPVLYSMTQCKRTHKRWSFRSNPVEVPFSRSSLLKKQVKEFDKCSTNIYRYIQ